MSRSKHPKTLAQRIFSERAAQLEKAVTEVLSRPEYQNLQPPKYTWYRKAIAQAAGYRSVAAAERSLKDSAEIAGAFSGLKCTNPDYESRLSTVLYELYGVSFSGDVAAVLDMGSRLESGGRILPTITVTSRNPRGLFGPVSSADFSLFPRNAKGILEDKSPEIKADLDDFFIRAEGNIEPRETDLPASWRAPFLKSKKS